MERLKTLTEMEMELDVNLFMQCDGCRLKKRVRAFRISEEKILCYKCKKIVENANGNNR